MDEYRHYVSGFFVQRDEAVNTLARLVDAGLPRARLKMYEKDSPLPATAQQAGSKEVLKDVLVDSAIGTVVGTGVGVLGELALVAANVSLFVASPLVAPLMLMGWGASVGGLIGAARGAADKSGGFAELVGDAVSNGQFVLVAETITEQETAVVREIIQDSVGVYKDTNAA